MDLDLGSCGKEAAGFSEELEQMGGGKGKQQQQQQLPFSYSSASSSPASSSSSQHKSHLYPPLTNSRWEGQHQQQQQQIHDVSHHQNWFGRSSSSSRYEEDHDDMELATATAATTASEVGDSKRGGDSDHSTSLELRSGSSNANNSIIEKEHMFDKVVTPSDVGKLNRLVIPKQHAEKYFPLDSSTNEKGLLLNFEDRNGKPWRFRYSYWNSSQSYVMTKGWSRFVKDKKLDAGDIVSFQRGVGESGRDRLFIDWRRRPDAPDPSSNFHPTHHRHPHFPLHHHHHRSSISWSPLFMRPPPTSAGLRDRDRDRDQYYHHPLNINAYYGGGGAYPTGTSNVVNPGSVFYLRSAPQMGMMEWQQQQLQQQQQQQLQGSSGVIHEPIVFDSVPVVQGKAAAKRLRLFGVNMDCPISESDHECEMFSPATMTMANATMVASQTTSSSSQQQQHPLQLRLYNGTPLPLQPPPTDFLSPPNKGKANSMSLDLDM